MFVPYLMSPEVRRTLIIADPISVHKIDQTVLSLKGIDNLRAGISAATIAVLVVLVVAFIRPVYIMSAMKLNKLGFSEAYQRPCIPHESATP